MRVDDLRSDRLNQSAARPTPAARPAAPSPAAPAAPVEPTVRADTVIISAEARALAAQQPGGKVTGSLPPERVTELRRWLAAGGHNDPEVIRQVAERLLASGDLNETANRE